MQAGAALSKSQKKRLKKKAQATVKDTSQAEASASVAVTGSPSWLSCVDMTWNSTSWGLLTNLQPVAEEGKDNHASATNGNGLHVEGGNHDKQEEDREGGENGDGPDAAQKTAKKKRSKSKY